ncbi:pyruvate, phosphate dikinase [Candidatus Poriferisocius sp.]|uniref:pyruvate, phosphate dikinase n=1 Tax=Candidatus Poriferisocius sp. TaxID=3101276 RepID=UPI003B01D8C7
MGVHDGLRKIGKVLSRGGKPTPIHHPFAEPPEVDRQERHALLGGKGASLAEMTQRGLPVPPGFTLTTEACRAYRASGWSGALEDAVSAGLRDLEDRSSRRLGSIDRPLLVSVRSGAAVSMPGMMDTVLNVGMNDEVEAALAAETGDREFAADAHRRFVLAYAEIVEGVPDGTLGPAAGSEPAPTAQELRDALTNADYVVPTDPARQLIEAVKAVFGSWTAPRAVAYRQHEGIAEDLGTACSIQRMVFGNLGPDSGTGVAFTRHPSTGESGITGDFLVGAQGEDVVSGTYRTEALDAMAMIWPHAYEQLVELASELEYEYRDMVDLEFTVEEGKLWLLQARVGKRSPAAVFRTALDMAEDPSFPLERHEAVERCRPLFDNPPMRASMPTAAGWAPEVLATGLPASPGRVTGVLHTDIDRAIREAEGGTAVILARPETSPRDVHGMAIATGLLTSLGGMVSHAAVVARAWGLPAVVGADDVDVTATGIICAGRHVEIGTTVTIDGSSGELLLGAHAGDLSPLPEVAIIKRWAQEGATPGADEAELIDGEQPELESLLRLLSIKGAATAAVLADALAATEAATAAVLGQAEANGLVTEGAGVWKPTEHAASATASMAGSPSPAERAALGAIVDRFHVPNLEFKELVTRWQMRTIGGETVVNDHADTAYDQSLIRTLRDDVHPAVSAIVEETAALAEHMADYTRRFTRALSRLEGGDRNYMAHPLLDSYHTVWFEFHEELIRLAGRTRRDEVEAGRA